MQELARKAKAVVDFVDGQCLRLSKFVNRHAEKYTSEQVWRTMDITLKFIGVAVIAVVAATVALKKGHAEDAEPLRPAEQQMREVGESISNDVMRRLEAEKAAERANSAQHNATTEKETTPRSN